MDLRFTDEDSRFAKRCASSSASPFPQTSAQKRAGTATVDGRDRALERILYDKGWATPAWGPSGAAPAGPRQAIHLQGRAAHGARPRADVVQHQHDRSDADRIRYEEQKRHFLPRIARLEYWFCQGFSEPGAGSDLAALRTHAVRDGDDYVINGQKIWTSTAHHADWCSCSCAPIRGEEAAGITYLLMDMKSPGITVRPIITLDGNHETNEMFLDNVRVPVANRVGEENKGWDYAKYLLGPRAQRHRTRRRVQDPRASRQGARRSRRVDGGPLSGRSAFSRARRGARSRAQGARNHADACDREIDRSRAANRIPRRRSSSSRARSCSRPRRNC